MGFYHAVFSCLKISETIIFCNRLRVINDVFEALLKNTDINRVNRSGRTRQQPGSCKIQKEIVYLKAFNNKRVPQAEQTI